MEPLCYFDYIPVEVLELILFNTGKWQGITAHVNHLWRDVIVRSIKDIIFMIDRIQIHTKCIIESISLIDWGIINGCTDICETAALHGNLKALQYSYEKGDCFSPRVFAAAAKGGNLEIVKYLHANKCPNSQSTIINAVKGGHLEILQFMTSHESTDHMTRLESIDHYVDNARIHIFAAENGHLHILKFLQQKRIYLGTGVTQVAAANGHLHILQYLPNDVIIDGCPGIITEAARNGHLEILKWLKENGHFRSRNASICDNAATFGNIEIIKWLRQNGCSWNVSTINAAIKNNKLEMLQFLHENGCPWQESTYSLAVDIGNLSIVKYLHKNSCPYQNDICNIATGNLEIFKYLHQTGHICNGSTYFIASIHNRMNIMQYLNEIGCPRPPVSH